MKRNSYFGHSYLELIKEQPKRSSKESIYSAQDSNCTEPSSDSKAECESFKVCKTLIKQKSFLLLSFIPDSISVQQTKKLLDAARFYFSSKGPRSHLGHSSSFEVAE